MKLLVIFNNLTQLIIRKPELTYYFWSSPIYSCFVFLPQGKHGAASEVVSHTSVDSLPYSVKSVDRKDSGIYECTAENNQGPKVSSSISIRVICKYSVCAEN